ncbi:MAG: hypothetical protein WCX65_20130, partial [bacterium]
MERTRRNAKYKAGVAAAFIWTFLLCAGPASTHADPAGQLLGPNRFDVDNPAVAVANEDVPPEILSVSFYPAGAAAGRPTLVAAEIQVNPDESENVVTEARALYRVGDASKWNAVPLAQSPSNLRLWMGEIPAQPAGTKIEAIIHAAASDGNRVMELPPTVSAWPPDPDEMFLVADDGADVIQHYPGSLDIRSFYVGLDGGSIYALATFQEKTARSTNGVFAHIYGFGVACPVDHWQRKINHELGYAKALMYLPLMNIKGFFNNIAQVGSKPDAE